MGTTVSIHFRASVTYRKIVLKYVKWIWELAYHFIGKRLIDQKTNWFYDNLFGFNTKQKTHLRLKRKSTKALDFAQRGGWGWGVWGWGVGGGT